MMNKVEMIKEVVKYEIGLELSNEVIEIVMNEVENFNCKDVKKIIENVKNEIGIDLDENEVEVILNEL